MQHLPLPDLIKRQRLYAKLLKVETDLLRFFTGDVFLICISLCSCNYFYKELQMQLFNITKLKSAFRRHEELMAFFWGLKSQTRV